MTSRTKKMAEIVGGPCMEGLWRGWHFDMIGMKKLQDEGYALSSNSNASVLLTFKNFEQILLFQMPCSTINFNFLCVLQDVYVGFFTLTLANYFCLNNILCKSLSTKAAIFVF